MLKGAQGIIFPPRCLFKINFVKDRTSFVSFKALMGKTVHFIYVFRNKASTWEKQWEWHLIVSMWSLSLLQPASLHTIQWLPFPGKATSAFPMFLSSVSLNHMEQMQLERPLYSSVPSMSTHRCSGHRLWRSGDSLVRMSPRALRMAWILHSVSMWERS